MLAAVENRFGNVLKAPAESEWLTDNGSGYTADKTRSFASSIGLEPLTTPICSPQSNGMAESSVKRMKRDYVAFMPKPDAKTAAHNLAVAIERCNEHHPHSALKYRSPREFRRRTDSSTQGLGGVLRYGGKSIPTLEHHHLDPGIWQLRLQQLIR
jgi:putative transposase